MNKKNTSPLSVVYKDYLKWIENNNVLPVKYETMVGLRGLKKNHKKLKKEMYAIKKKQNELIDNIYNHLGSQSNNFKKFFIRCIINLTVSKGRVGDHKHMNKYESDLFYKYFPRTLLDKLYKEN